MPKILILTSKTGGGHVSLAEALEYRLAGEFAIEIIDPQPGIIHTHYRLLSRHALWLWAAEFKMSDTPERALAAHKMFSALFARGLGEVIARAQPDAILTTYPFLTYEVGQALKRIGVRPPLGMLFADPNSVHHTWLTERNAAMTFAPTRETHAQALAAGFAPERLCLSGWPVRGQFYSTGPETRAQTLAQLNLPADSFTVFLQGGGEGAAKIARTVENLLSVPGIQIILAVGTNRALLARFQNVPHLRPVPFTKQIAPYMAAADVVMGKAGPNMLFESVTLGKPFIATTYIPGQEEVNLAYIDRHQLGWSALTAQDQHNLVQSLAADPAQLAGMRERVNAYRQWNNEASAAILPMTRAMLNPALNTSTRENPAC